MKYWLIKTEPDDWSWIDQVKSGESGGYGGMSSNKAEEIFSCGGDGGGPGGTSSVGKEKEQRGCR